MKNIFLTVMMLFSLTCLSQVGVGTTTPNGALDVSSSTNGLIPPRVALTATNVAAPVVNPQGGALVAGTLVWNTATAGTIPNNVIPGMYYWDGTRWISLAGSPGGLDWSLSGNTGTNPATNYVGTTDNVPLILRANSIERIRMGTSETVVNEDAQNYDFRVEGTGEPEMFFVDASTNHVHIRAASPFPTVDMFTSVAIANDFPINGYSSGSGWGLYGQNTSTTGGSYGAVGISSDSAGGHGVGGVANGTTTVTSPVDLATGVVGNGSELGVYGQSTNTTGERYGGYFVGGDITNTSTPIAFVAGVDGAGEKFGGYFDGNSDNNAGGGGGNAGEDYAFVGIRTGGTTYKIVGTGSNSTMVNYNGEKRVLFSPEAPEILFQDFGTSKLINGERYIKIDPILAENIFVDERHPLKVFIQLEGDCNGVYVTEKTKEGFKVKELQNGQSNVEFSWQLVATRANTVVNGEVFSKHVDVRFPVGPKKIKIKETKSETKKDRKK